MGGLPLCHHTFYHMHLTQFQFHYDIRTWKTYWALCNSLIDINRFLHAGCGHELCVRCALYLCSTNNVSSEMVGPPGSIPCPLCRHGIVSFVKLPGSQAKENKLHVSLGLCTSCMLHPRDLDQPSLSHTPEIRRNRVASVPSEMLCPVTCGPFPSMTIPLCTCNDGPCPTFEPREAETQDESPPHSQSSTTDQDKMEGPRLDKTTCSSMFWGRRSCSREHQCNSEINAWFIWCLYDHSYVCGYWIILDQQSSPQLSY